MSKTKFLSVVLATHNEAENIGKCLDSIKDFADEIIIVDGESTDDTVTIAKSYKAKVIQTTNKPNFHINKQMAMDEAKGKYVLQLDADEVVDADLLNFLERLKEEASQVNEREQDFDILTNHLNHIEPKGWWIKRKNFFLGRWLSKGGQYPDSVIRLYENGFAELPQKDVHEQMVVDGETEVADGHLLHYSNPTFTEYLVKFNRYTSFAATQLPDKGVVHSVPTTLDYLVLKPLKTFFQLYFRHKGFVDGVPGFVFAAMSGLYHAISYLKFWEQQQTS